jgi:preprotein translocase subunit Sec61beta
MNIARTFKAVAWSFFGVRKGSEYERDVAELKPQQVIVVGIACAALFVLALVAIVNWVVNSGVAAG